MSNFNNTRTNTAVRDYESMAIIGGRGVGKSTLMRCLGDMYAKQNPDRRVLVHDSSNSKAFSTAYRWFGIGMDDLIDGMPIEGSDTKKLIWDKGKRKISTLEDRNYESPPERRFRALQEKKGVKLPKVSRPEASEPETTARYLFKYFKNGLLMLDEAYEWGGFSPPRWADSLIYKHRNKGLDIMLVYHDFNLVPKRWRRHFNKFVIFKSDDGDEYDEKSFKSLGYKRHELMYEAYRKVNEMPYQNDKYIQPFKIVDLSVR